MKVRGCPLGWVLAFMIVIGSPLLATTFPNSGKFRVSDVWVATGNVYQIWHNNGTNYVNLGTVPPNTSLTSANGCGFDSSFRPYAADSGAQVIDRLSELSHNPITTKSAQKFPVSTGMVQPNSLVFDGAGNFYVGDAGAPTIKEFDPYGNQINFFSGLPVDSGAGPAWIDISAGKLFYTTNGTKIYKFDPGPQTTVVFADTSVIAKNLVDHLGALRMLPNGNVLVANGVDHILQISADGTTVVKTYDVSGKTNWVPLTLDTSGVNGSFTPVSFWAGDVKSTKAIRFNIATGAVEATLSTGTRPAALCVQGGFSLDQPVLNGAPQQTLTAQNPVATVNTSTNNSVSPPTFNQATMRLDGLSQSVKLNVYWVDFDPKATALVHAGTTDPTGSFPNGVQCLPTAPPPTSPTPGTLPPLCESVKPDLNPDCSDLSQTIDQTTGACVPPNKTSTPLFTHASVKYFAELNTNATDAAWPPGKPGAEPQGTNATLFSDMTNPTALTSGFIFIDGYTSGGTRTCCVFSIQNVSLATNTGGFSVIGCGYSSPVVYEPAPPFAPYTAGNTLPFKIQAILANSGATCSNGPFVDSGTIAPYLVQVLDDGAGGVHVPIKLAPNSKTAQGQVDANGNCLYSPSLTSTKSSWNCGVILPSQPGNYLYTTYDSLGLMAPFSVEIAVQ
ncbi:MAG TPA: hypothetical protein VFI95_11410 [Terriglobales bacterium]|nr:hypothetical protein [Terriglobales bacterium]